MNAPARQPSAFFSLNGRYEIAETTTIRQMAEDGGCITGCALAMIQSLVDGLGDPESHMAANPKDAVTILYGVLYFVGMANHLFEGIEVRSLRG